MMMMMMMMMTTKMHTFKIFIVADTPLRLEARDCQYNKIPA
jgi:hypothetical protein